ncbi:hypothetical protein QAD02_018164 [Eretmocerus hayati]|uniref:Uncharacterized protein n=1 Tax=Eretmocerus hayati TaxID=131215 RepID=A0ACC2PGA2_9HYME|nr:hypothetical protein QAD02_018164 [Eretmocerus hayati]
MVIAGTFDDLSPLSRKIIQRAEEDCGAMISDHDGIDQMTNFHDANWKSPSYEGSILGPSTLTIGIVETWHEFDCSREMSTALEVFYEQGPFRTSKFLINLITDHEFDLEHILRNSWSTYGFVDTTIIQWILNDRIQGISINVTHELSHQVFVHSYNPFNNTFRSEALIERTKLFPEKLKDLYGYSLVTTLEFARPPHAMVNKLTEKPYRETWIFLTRMLMEAINCTLRIKTEDELSTFKPQAFPTLHAPVLRYHQSYGSILDNDPEDEWSWRLFYHSNLGTIHIPSPVFLHLYVLQTKSYRDDVSFAAIVAFGGLFFTAFIFAVWGQFLGLKDRNWSFLNILTAQMGGSVAHGRPMKLSEMIFQMSIYIATFIIVTLGTDYMLQIFILHHEPREIRTTKELADSDIFFIVDMDDFWDFADLPHGDFEIEIIKSRIHVKLPDQGFYAFCKLPSRDLSEMVDTKINLCISHSENKQFILPSDSKFQINKIEDPILMIMPSMEFAIERPFLKKRLNMMVDKFSEVGLIDMWRNSRRRMYNSSGDSQSTTRVKEDQIEARPLQDQLWPILVVGSTVSIAALIAELIWKRFIEGTEIGNLVSAFYRL